MIAVKISGIIAIWIITIAACYCFAHNHEPKELYGNNLIIGFVLGVAISATIVVIVLRKSK